MSLILSGYTGSVHAQSTNKTLVRSSPSSQAVSASSSSASTTVPANFFGMSVNKGLSEQTNMPFTYGTTRTWDVYPGLSWVELNPSSGTYNWTNLDNYITYNSETNQADIIYTFGLVPAWASTNTSATCHDGTGTCAPPNLAAWDAYVTALATHVAGKIKYWELWNEPEDSAYYAGDVATMVAMAQHAYAIIKSLDSTAVVISPACSAGVSGTGPAWLKSFLAAGGGTYVDVIGFHGYADLVAENVSTAIANYKTVMSGAGVSSKPLWDTESSWAGAGTEPSTSSAKSAFLAKDYLLHWSGGVSRFVWYEYDGGIWGGLWDVSTGPYPAATAYGQVKTWMAGATMTQSCTADANSTYSCKLARSGGYTAQVVWNSAQSMSFTPDSSYTQYRNLAGDTFAVSTKTSITVSNEPIILESGTSPYPN